MTNAPPSPPAPPAHPQPTNETDDTGGTHVHTASSDLNVTTDAEPSSAPGTGPAAVVPATPRPSSGAGNLLVLAPEGTAREALRRSLVAERFKVDFCTGLSEVVGLLTNRHPVAFLHDYGASDESQARQLQMRLSKLSEYDGVVRVAMVDTITTALLAHANDAAIARLLTRATPPSGVASSVSMTLAARRAGGGMRSLQDRLRGNEYRQEDIDAAVEKAFTEFPHDPDVKLEFGNLLVRRDALTEARRHGEELLAKAPTNVRAMNLVARTLMKEGRFDEALATLRDADALSPENPARLVLIGDAFFGKGDLASAGKAYGTARALDPDDKGAASGLGQVKLSEGDADAALALFKDSLSEDEAVGFFNNAGVAAVRAGQVEEGLRLYDTALAALRSAGNRHQILFNKALALRRVGDIDEAIKVLRKTVRLAPEFEKATRLLAALEEVGGRRV